MTTDYNKCRNVQGTTSMCYNPFTQRGWIADVNSKRDIAVEQLRNQLAAKTASYYWSDTGGVTITTPQASSDEDNSAEALTAASNIWALVRTAGGGSMINKQVSSVNKPSSVAETFKFTDNAGTGSNVNELATFQYVGLDEQLVQLNATVTYTKGTDAKDVSIAFQYREDFATDWAWINFAERNVTFGDAPTAVDEISITANLSVITKLYPNNVVGLFCWCSPTGTGAATKISQISTSIITLP